MKLPVRFFEFLALALLMLFVALLVGVTVIVGALTFFPALSLGPIVEHFFMHQGKLWS